MKKTALALAIAMVLSSEQALANPTGAEVVRGSASFSNPTPNELSVSNSHNAIINWQRFGIAAGETTRFIQPSAASSVLNRVIGNDPSAILGNLHSNGRVFLINHNGILVGEGAHIDTAGFLASTLNITDEDFLNGRLHFEGGGLGGIENHGYIHAGEGGNIVLIAPNIDNGGVLEVDNGNIVLAAGNSITITSLENPAIEFEVSAAGHEVVNLGEIIAHRGSASLFARTLKHSGHIRANGLVRDGDGRIRLVAVDSTEVSGEISAGTEAQGGDIRVLGDTVAIRDGATVDASGANGGGEILIGGDQQGLNPAIQNATSTTIQQGARVSADATDKGAGGRVIVFAENDVHVHGEVSATGGPNGGDGGFIETSGKRVLDITRAPDAAAPNGQGGEWLIDPFNITIVAGSALVPTSPLFSPPAEFVSGADTQIGVDLINAALAAATKVTITTGAGGTGAGDITLNAPVIANNTVTAPITVPTLTLNAHNDININADITAQTFGFDLLFNPDLDNSGGGQVNFATTTITLGSGADVTLNGASSVQGVLTIPNRQNWAINGPMTIAPGGTFQVTRASIGGPAISGTGRIVNTGLFSHDTGCGEGDDCNPSSFNIDIVNNATLRIVSGVMPVGGDFDNSGLIDIQAAGSGNGLHFFSGSGAVFSLLPGTSISAVSTATIEINDTTVMDVTTPVVFPSIMTLELNNGRINNVQNLVAPDRFDLFGGTLSGSGNFVSQDKAIVSLSDFLGPFTVTLEGQSAAAPLRWISGGTLDLRNFSSSGPHTFNLNNAQLISRGQMNFSGPTEFKGVGAATLQNEGFMALNNSSFPQTDVLVDTQSLTFNNFGEIELQFGTQLDLTADTTRGQLVLPTLTFTSGAGTIVADVVMEGGVISGGFGSAFDSPLIIDGNLTINSGGVATKISGISQVSSSKVVANAITINGGDAAFWWQSGDDLLFGQDNKQFPNFLECAGPGCVSGPGFNTIVRPIGVLQGDLVNVNGDGLGFRTTTLDPSRNVVFWEGLGDSFNWGDPSNWSSAVVPVAGDYVFIDSSTNILVNTPTNAIKGLQLNGHMIVSPGQTLNMAGDVMVLDQNRGGGYLVLEGGSSNPASINGSGVLYNMGPTLAMEGGSIQLDVVNWSDIDALAPGAVFSGNLVNHGVIAGAQNVTVNGNFNWASGTVVGTRRSSSTDPYFTTNGVTDVTSGVLRADWLIGPNGVVNWGGSNADIFDVGDSSFTNQGAFNVSSFPASAPTTSLPNLASASITGYPSLSAFFADQQPQFLFDSPGFSLTVPGITGGSSSVALRNLPSSASFINQGQLFIDAGLPGQAADTVIFRLSFSNEGGDVIVNSGSFSLNGQALLLDQSTESLQGFGTFIGNVINSAGLVSPGLTDSASGVAKTGALTIQGDYEQGANGTLAIKLDGSGTALLHDRLNVSGQVTANGTVSFALVNGSTAARVNSLIGPDFSPLGFASFSGSFSNVQLPSGLNIVFNPDGSFGVSGGNQQLDQLNSALTKLLESKVLDFDDLVISMNFVEEDLDLLDDDDDKKKRGGRLICK